jgi:predicted phage tail protein
MSSQQPDELAQREMASDLKAAVGARRELSDDMEDHVLEAFLARVQSQVDARVQQQVAQAMATRPNRSKGGGEGHLVGVVTGSLALAIPLIAIAAAGAGSVGVFFVMAGVVLVNLLFFIDRWR